MNTATPSTVLPVDQSVAALNASREAAVSSGQSAYGGANASLATFKASNPPPVNQTQDANAINNHLSGSSTGVTFPSSIPAPTQSVSSNTSVPTPIPTAQSIIEEGNKQTPGETTNQSLLEKVASLIGQKKSQGQLTNTAETAAGVPALQKTVNDLNTQLEGLNNQATDLQNQASAGGAIQNKEQQDVLGRGVTAAGLAPITAGDLRKNQIQQSAIASQALTLKSAIYGAQGNLAIAKDAADKAADAQYEDQQNQIDYQNALIQANLPQMTKEEKNQAAIVQAKLAERQSQLDDAKDSKKTIIAMATATLAAYPNDSAAHYAAQQALNESNQQSPDLTKVLGLLAKYPSLATQQATQELKNAKLTGQKLQNEVSAGGTTSALSPYLKTSYDGSQYVDLSTLTPSDKNKYAQIAAANGVKAVLTPQDADKVSHIAVTKSNLNDILNTFNSVPTTKIGFPAAQGVTNSIKGFFGDATIKAYADYRTSAINTLQALAGGTGSGFRINQSEVNAAIKDIPVLTGPSADTPASAAAKIANLNGQIDKWQTQILGGGNTATNDAKTQVVNGVTYYQHADGLYYTTK